MVATKAALSIRVDALTDDNGKSEPSAPSIGLENRAKLESRLRSLEHGNDLAGVRRFGDGGKKQPRFEMKGETKTYNSAADAVDLVSTQRDPMEAAVKVALDVKEEKRKAKELRRAKKREEKVKAESESVEPEDDDMDVDGEDSKAAKEKKRKRRESEPGPAESEEVKVHSPKLTWLCYGVSLTYVCDRRRKRRLSGRQGRRRRRKQKRRRKRRRLKLPWLVPTHPRKRKRSRRHRIRPLLHHVDNLSSRFMGVDLCISQS